MRLVFMLHGRWRKEKFHQEKKEKLKVYFFLNTTLLCPQKFHNGCCLQMNLMRLQLLLAPSQSPHHCTLCQQQSPPAVIGTVNWTSLHCHLNLKKVRMKKEKKEEEEEEEVEEERRSKRREKRERRERTSQLIR